MGVGQTVVISALCLSPHALALLLQASHLVWSVGTFGLMGALMVPGMVTFQKDLGGDKHEYWITKHFNMLANASHDLVPISP